MSSSKRSVDERISEIGYNEAQILTRDSVIGRGSTTNILVIDANSIYCEALKQGFLVTETLDFFFKELDKNPDCFTEIIFSSHDSYWGTAESPYVAPQESSQNSRFLGHQYSLMAWESMRNLCFNSPSCFSRVYFSRDDPFTAVMEHLNRTKDDLGQRVICSSNPLFGFASTKHTVILDLLTSVLQKKDPKCLVGEKIEFREGLRCELAVLKAISKLDMEPVTDFFLNSVHTFFASSASSSPFEKNVIKFFDYHFGHRSPVNFGFISEKNISPSLFFLSHCMTEYKRLNGDLRSSSIAILKSDYAMSCPNPCQYSYCVNSGILGSKEEFFTLKMDKTLMSTKCFLQFSYIREAFSRYCYEGENDFRSSTLQQFLGLASADADNYLQKDQYFDWDQLVQEPAKNVPVLLALILLEKKKLITREEQIDAKRLIRELLLDGTKIYEKCLDDREKVKELSKSNLWLEIECCMMHILLASEIFKRSDKWEFPFLGLYLTSDPKLN